MAKVSKLIIPNIYVRYNSYASIYISEMDKSEILIKKVGERIVELRKDKGMSQIELSIKLNIEDSALRRIEKGRTNPTLKTLCKIAEELGVRVSDLIGD